MNLAVDLLSATALLVFAVGVVGLLACTLATGPRRSRRARAPRPPAPPQPQLRAPAVQAAIPRRTITGLPARERLAAEVAPARQRPLSPDVHRRERARQRSDDDFDFVLELLDSEPERVVEVVERWLAEDEAKAQAEADAYERETRGKW